MNTMDIDEALSLLCSTDYFQKLSFNEDGSLFDQIAALYLILEHKNAAELFIKIFDATKTNEGKLYALVGLFFTDRNGYFLKKTEISNFSVTTFIADTSDIENIMDVLDELEKGELQELLFWNINP
jgi:hypothetical protein